MMRRGNSAIRRIMLRLQVRNFSTDNIRCWPPTNILKFTRLAVCVVLGWIFLANISHVQAFKQDVVDQLLVTQKCLRCDLRDANLAFKNLRAVKREGAYLSGANLESSDLRGANLSGAWLIRAKIRRENLASALLRSVRLIDADLKGADIRNARLQDSMMARAKLTNSSLHETELSGANMQGVELSGAVGLTHDQLSMACGDAKTIVPYGFSIPPCKKGMQ